ncbi:MAG: cytochrome c family protein [Hyphomicrobiales bacterium]
MKLPDFNTIAMGFLFTIFIALGVSFLSELVFHVEKPEKPGYIIEVAEAEGAAGTEEEAVELIGPLLASADVGAGEKLVKRCTACHSFEKGGANKVGPYLYDVVGRDIAGVSDFGYSGSMAEYGAGKKWTYDELDGFLEKPSKWIKGTAMGFGGLKKIEARANLIAYMRTLSDNPTPLPSE